ncbi:MAG: DUF58 domain-containing protein [SAR324 cluster bacterium]|nr:DUF58 domain-containing protein [SAR324 cluster bacterium]
MSHQTAEQARELLRKVAKVQLNSRAQATDLMAGAYQSAFKGQGMEFDQVREYQAGDEPRQVDWNVTARLGKPFVKSFIEERSLSLLFVVDASASMLFGSGASSKKDWLIEVIATLAFNAVKKNDQVGLLLFSDQVHSYIPPKKGLRHALRLVRDLIEFQPTGHTNLKMALDYANKIIKGRAVIFLVSDFLTANFVEPLNIPTHRHDFVALEVKDPLEAMPFNIGLVELKDLETGASAMVDTNHKPWQRAYQAEQVNRAEAFKKTLRKYAIDHLPLVSGEPFAGPLQSFFKRRGKRR